MPSIKYWRAQALRLTVFPSMEKDMEKLPGWEAIVGNTPDQIKQQLKKNIVEEKYIKGGNIQ